MTDAELLATLDRMRSTMISVATGGARIGMVNHEFQEEYRAVADALAERGIENPLPYGDLWQWYGKWSADIPGYAPRRAYVAELLAPLIARVRSARVSDSEPTGWERVDRTMQDARERLPRAKNEEHFQAIGLLCREALITLAQEVFDPAQHTAEPSVRVSSTGFKRMIEAYIMVEMRGGSAEELRHASTPAPHSILLSGCSISAPQGSGTQLSAFRLLAPSSTLSRSRPVGVIPRNNAFWLASP